MKTLSMNFRSVPAVLDEVSRHIEPVMIRREGLQPQFQTLIPCDRLRDARGFEEGLHSPIEHWVMKGWNRKAEEPVVLRMTDATVLEAKTLADDLDKLHHEHGVAWKDVGVLFRSTGDIDVYGDALREAGIPYAVTRDRSYFKRREVIDASAVVRCILEPNDHLALLTMLRSVAVGAPDAALIGLWAKGFPECASELWGTDPGGIDRVKRIVAEVKKEMVSGVPGIERAPGWDRNLVRALESVSVLRESFESDPADVFVETLRMRLLIEPLEAARYLGAYRLANLDRFFQSLLMALEEGGSNPQSILRSLRTGVARAEEAEEGRFLEAAENAVQLMTVHKAKGLDFDHVYLVQMQKQSRNTGADRTDAKQADNRWEYTLFGAPTLGYGKVAGQKKAVESAELVRTLYVAMTRAKHRLVLCGDWPGEGETKKRGNVTHMDIIRNGSDLPPADGLMKQAAALETDRTDEAGVRWVFPGLRSPEPVAIHRDRGPAHTLPEAHEIAQASSELSRRKKRAAERMERPFRGAASGESHEALNDRFMTERSDALEHETAIPEPKPEEQQTPDEAAKQTAMAVGSVIHRILETADLYSDPEKEIRRHSDLLPEYLSKYLESFGPDVMEKAVIRAKNILDRLQEGPLWKKLFGLRNHIVARELPLLIPPEERGKVRSDSRQAQRTSYTKTRTAAGWSSRITRRTRWKRTPSSTIERRCIPRRGRST